ncbi:hypothetical protein A4X13_0g4315 [Tilletia indica]|uniref:Chromosome transmission fidelity protein 8 n=1 Tax=Tilletia indica TaxID=43049 RepID=A0A177TY86_9BASI|nr:hypothetical protein A4X13_0g4315 [Tilletia indica]
MRIDIRLPSAGPSASSSNGSSSSSKDAITSPPIAKLSPSGELVLIELQGALELEGLDAANPQTIGMLTFEGPKQDKPVLLISHHRLYGKFVDLHQPLAILQKHQREPPASLDSSPSAKRRWLEQPWTSDVESDGEGEGTLGEEEEGERKKRVKRNDGEDERESGPPSSSPCRPSSVQKKKIDRKATEGGEEDKDDDLVAEWDDDEDDGDENDGGEDSKKDGENAGGKRKRSQGGRKPRVWYDVVSVIRRKILFSQRPEPVVNLGPEHSLAVSSVTTSSSSSLLAS